MADIESVKAGDTLRVPVKVIYQEGQRHPGGPLVCRVEMPSGREDSLSFTDVEAAEHIPAPKVFKRGDWVRTRGTLRHGLVLRRDGLNTTRYWVDWPNQISSGRHAVQMLAQDLERDEAP